MRSSQTWVRGARNGTTTGPSLSATQLRSFRDEGFLVVEELLTDETCLTAIATAESLAQLEDGSTIMQPHRRHDLFLGLLRDPRITRPIVDVVGAPVDGLATQFFFAPPGSSGLMKHQDNFCVEAPLGAFASCWIALVDVTEANGCLIVYPKSHAEGMAPVRPLRGDELRETYPNMREESVLPDGAERGVKVLMPRGSGVFLHGALIHESLPNRTALKRYAFLATYLRSGAPFRPGHTAKREPIPLIG